MIRSFLICILAAGVLTGEIGSQPFENGDVVGFCGDSITHAEYSEINYTHVLYNYYVTHMPEEEIELRNLGVGGARIINGLELYGRDPAAAGLDKAVLEYGINDLNAGYYENEAVYEESGEERKNNLEEYRGNLSAFLKELHEDAIGGENIYITTLALPGSEDEQSKESPDAAAALAWEGYGEISEIARETSREQGIGLVEFQNPLTELAQTLSREEIMEEDNLHVNTNGQIYLAYLFLQQQGALRDVSRVEIEKGSISSDNARAFNLHYKDGYLYYDYQPHRLPMGISEEYREADAVLNILDKMSREIIQVKDLQEDAVYDIYINGEQIGSYEGADFAEGVNIANLAENPAQKYAVIIEQMNRGRRVTELAYRKQVQNSTDCGSGRVTEEELAEAYETWREEDAAYRRSMYELAQEGIRVTKRVAVVRRGAQVPEAAFFVPGRNYKKIAAVIMIFVTGAAAAVVFYAKRKKRKQ